MGEVPVFLLMQAAPPALPLTGSDLKRRAAGGTRRPLISNMMDTELLSSSPLTRPRFTQPWRRNRPADKCSC